MIETGGEHPHECSRCRRQYICDEFDSNNCVGDQLCKACQPVKVIFVGKPGVGKTVGYYDFPKPMLVIDRDRKVETIKYLLKSKVRTRRLKGFAEFDDKDMKSIQFIPYEQRTFNTMFDDLNNAIRYPPMAPDGQPGTLVLDSLTSIADETINYGLQIRGGGKSMGVIQIPDLPEWLGESMFLSSLFNDVTALPCNVVLTAHMVITEREVMATKADRAKGLSGGNKITKQLMTGGTKIGNKIPVYFSEVWNFQNIPAILSSDPSRRVVYTQVTDECDFVRTKFELPSEIDITYKRGEEYQSLWSIVNAARELAGKETEIVRTA